MTSLATEQVNAAEQPEKEHLVCTACGYGAYVQPDRLPACPMCRAESWSAR